MGLWLWSLYFLPVSGALKILPEVKLDGKLGGSITFECPLPEIHVRIYLCRQMAKPRICTTVVSNNFIKKEYESRVTLKLCSDKNLFLVEMTELTQSDGGVYACGVGMHTDRGKTQKVTLNVHSAYRPFWEEELISKSPKWFHMSDRLQMVAHASSSESISKVTTPTQRTEDPPGLHPSVTTPIIHHPQAPRASLVAKPSALLPSTTASKTSAQEGLLRPPGASYNQHTRLHGQSLLQAGPPTGDKDASAGSLPAAPTAEAALPEHLQRLPAARSRVRGRPRTDPSCGPRTHGAPSPTAGA
uniref:Fc mu receptor n=1 Tax=Sciurus vulgaris TaxID=55149 RepID=A0A8D2DXL0_SCIVU